MKRARPYPRILRFDAVADARGSKSIIIVAANAPQRFELVCCCEQRRDANGHCRHSKRYWSILKPWYRARTRILLPLGMQEKRELMNLDPDLTNRPLTAHPRAQGAERWVW